MLEIIKLFQESIKKYIVIPGLENPKTLNIYYTDIKKNINQFIIGIYVKYTKKDDVLEKFLVNKTDDSETLVEKNVDEICDNLTSILEKYKSAIDGAVHGNNFAPFNNEYD